jgi:hypothetical protein
MHSDLSRSATAGETTLLGSWAVGLWLLAVPWFTRVRLSTVGPFGRVAQSNTGRKPLLGRLGL